MKILWTKKQEADFVLDALEDFAQALREAALKVMEKPQAKPEVDLPLPPAPEAERYEFKGYL